MVLLHLLLKIRLDILLDCKFQQEIKQGTRSNLIFHIYLSIVFFRLHASLSQEGRVTSPYFLVKYQLSELL